MATVIARRRGNQFRIDFNSKLGLIDGSFISSDGSFWNGTWKNLDLTTFMSPEDILRPYNIYVNISSSHSDDIPHQISNAPVYYCMRFEGQDLKSYHPASDYHFPPLGLVSYKTVQGYSFVDTNETNKPIYVTNLKELQSIAIEFVDANSNIVNFGNPLMLLQLTFDAADWYSRL
jgi:hypothetical protein